MKKISGYFSVDLGAGSDVGSVREQNEDAFHTLLGTGSDKELFDALLIVADGMGGHAAGEVASEMAVTNLPKHLVEAISSADDHEDLAEILSESVRKTNRDIFDKSKEDDTRGMGTTLTVGMVVEDEFIYAHVGDSRGYLLREGSIEQFTTDHSWVGEQVALGILTEEQAENHPRRNIITRAMGLDSTVEVDSGSVKLLLLDQILLCSDGLHGLVKSEDIVEICNEEDPEDAFQSLIDMANGRGGHDNITVVIAKMDEGVNYQVDRSQSEGLRSVIGNIKNLFSD
ncbi:MAG: Stp1/IreP family PP2C-type Ser/Thr phosphatase [Dehalococcoidia bacterium]|tara:strand:+ start:2610 stop:3464 length:855 start_codon:yes stop_codon:yes gene_type:complete